MKTLLLIVSLTISSLSVFSNDDWGKTGHRTTGKIAEKHLTRKAKKAIHKLLEGESLAFVSTFADEIKSDKKYNKFYSWHYVNFPLDGNYKDSEKNPKGDLITGINHCIAVLKDNNSTKEDKVFYLKILVHLVGDLHQPMHVGQAEDKGGNDIKVKWFYKSSNLHRVWDTDMIAEYKMSYTELADSVEELSKTEINQIKNGSVLDWVSETHELTREVYNSVEENENLRYKYSYKYLSSVRKQLQKGGIRLAKLLNEIFG
jgi:hypothetical protein